MMTTSLNSSSLLCCFLRSILFTATCHHHHHQHHQHHQHHHHHHPLHHHLFSASPLSGNADDPAAPLPNLDQVLQLTSWIPCSHHHLKSSSELFMRERCCFSSPRSFLSSQLFCSCHVFRSDSSRVVTWHVSSPRRSRRSRRFSSSGRVTLGSPWA